MPPLEERTVAALLAEGLNTGRDPKLVSDGCLALENAWFQRDGAISKRCGTKSLTGSYSERSMGVHQGRPVLYGDNLRVFDGASGTSGSFVDAGETPRTDIETTPLYQCADFSTMHPNVGIAGSVLAVGGWEKITTLHRYSRTKIAEATADGAAQVVVVGTHLVVLDSAGYREINTTTGAIGARTAYATAPFGPDSMVDWAVMSSTVLMMVYQSDAKQITIGKWDLGGGAFTSVNTVKAWDITGRFAAWKMAADFMIAWGGLPGGGFEELWVEGWSQLLVQSISADRVAGPLAVTSTVTTMAGYATSDFNSTVYFTIIDSTLDHSIDAVWRNTFTHDGMGGGSGGIATVLAKNMRLASKPFGTAPHVRLLLLFLGTVVSSKVPVQRSLFAVTADGKLAGKLLYGTALTASSYDLAEVLFQCPPVAGQEIGGVFYLAATMLRGAGAAVCLVAATPGQFSARPVEIGPYLLLPNSQPFVFDGLQVTEHGFACYPEGVKVSVGGAGGTIEAGTYAIRVTYEWTDAQSRLVRSVASEAVQFDIVLGQKATYSIPILPLTMRSNVKVVVWRTKKNGATYYERTQLTNDVLDFDGLLAFEDGLPDASALKARSLYFEEGGVLEATPCPAHRIAAAHQTRHFVVDRDEEAETFWYSKPLEDGIDIEHSDVLRGRVDRAGGRITALSSFMGRLIIWKERAIYAASGEGLDNLGAGLGYGQPMLINPAVGCKNAKSIVEIPAGLMFESEGGICLLTRALEVQPIGARVREQTKNYAILGAALIPDREHVVFLTSGPALVYSYRFDRWATWTVHEAADGIAAGGRLYRVTSTGVVVSEDRSTFLDDAAQVVMVVDTGWFAFANLLGHERTRQAMLLLQNISRHKLAVEVMYNYVPAPIDDLEFDSRNFLQFDYSAHYAAALPAVNGDKAYVLKVVTSQQKCTAIRYRISDVRAVVKRLVAVCSSARTLYECAAGAASPWSVFAPAPTWNNDMGGMVVGLPDGGIILSGGSYGGTYKFAHYDPIAATWSYLASPVSLAAASCMNGFGLSRERAYACAGGLNKLLTFNGTSWSVLGGAAWGDAEGGDNVWASAENNVWVTCGWGAAHVRQWNGTAWVDHTAAMTAALGLTVWTPRGVWGVGSTVLVAINDITFNKTRVAKYDGAWSWVGAGGDTGIVGNICTAIWASDLTHIWVLTPSDGSKKTIVFWNGVAWSVQKQNSVAGAAGVNDLRLIAGTGGNVLACCPPSSVPNEWFGTINGGAAWNDLQPTWPDANQPNGMGARGEEEAPFNEGWSFTALAFQVALKPGMTPIKAGTPGVP